MTSCYHGYKGFEERFFCAGAIPDRAMAMFLRNLQTDPGDMTQTESGCSSLMKLILRSGDGQLQTLWPSLRMTAVTPITDYLAERPNRQLCAISCHSSANQMCGESDTLESVTDGNSPNCSAYRLEKRPSSQKPQTVAASVTVWHSPLTIRCRAR